MKKILVLLSATLLLVSCGRRVLLDETHQVDNNVWLWPEPEAFSFDVRNIDNPYVITLTMSYDTQLLRLNAVPLKVEFFADSNARHTLFPSLILIDRSGARRGTMLDRFCTVTDTLDRCRLYNEAGRYTYSFKQLTGKYELEGVAKLGMKVERL